jgi:hypothetical protein
MVRRFLIRLRFRPVIGRAFDLLPAAIQLAWFGETNTAAPGAVYVPPRDVPVNPGHPKPRA